MKYCNIQNIITTTSRVIVLDEEFFKQYPISIYHGTRVQDGTVHARFTNPRVADGIYGVTEPWLHKGIMQAREHQARFAEDNRNAAELEVKERALREVQAEKRRLGMPLESPRLDGGPPVLMLIPGGREPV